MDRRLERLLAVARDVSRAPGGRGRVAVLLEVGLLRRTHWTGEVSYGTAAIFIVRGNVGVVGVVGVVQLGRRRLRKVGRRRMTMEDVEVDVFLGFVLLVTSHFGDGRTGIPCNGRFLETGD